MSIGETIWNVSKLIFWVMFMFIFMVWVYDVQEDSEACNDFCHNLSYERYESNLGQCLCIDSNNEFKAFVSYGQSGFFKGELR